MNAIMYACTPPPYVCSVQHSSMETVVPWTYRVTWVCRHIRFLTNGHRFELNSLIRNIMIRFKSGFCLTASSCHAAVSSQCSGVNRIMLKPTVYFLREKLHDVKLNRISLFILVRIPVHLCVCMCAYACVNACYVCTSRVLHIGRSSASYFNFQYPLFSLRLSSSFQRLHPRLSITSMLPSIFRSIMCFRSQFYARCDQYSYLSFYLL
jgi:hypothetical protein